MKIIQKTPTQLTTEDRPISHRLMGIVEIFLGFLMLLWALSSPTSDTLLCTRTQTAQIDCKLTKRSLLGKQDTRSISNLQGASLNYTASRKSALVNLVTTTDSVQLLPSWTAKSTVDDINQFLTTPTTPSLLLTENDQNMWALGLAGLTWVFIGVYLLLLPIRTATFDKQMRQMRLKTQNLLGTKVIDQSISVPLSLEVKGSGRMYYLMLNKLSLSNMGDKKQLEEMASKIRDFLG